MFDGNWVEMAKISCGCAGIAVEPIIRWFKAMNPSWVSRDASNDFMNAASLAPFGLLVAGVFNRWIFNPLVGSGKSSLGLAGGIGVLYVSKELITVAKAPDKPTVG